MLIQSTPDTVTLLPALPQQWLSGKVRGLRARGCFIVDMEWENGKVTSLEISSPIGGSTTIVTPVSTHSVTLGRDERKKII